MNKKTQIIAGVAIMIVGILIIGLEVPDLINNKQEDFGMMIVGLLNILLGSIILGTSRRKKCSEKQSNLNKTKASKAIIVLGILALLGSIITTSITLNYIHGIMLATPGILMITSGILLKKEKTQCNS
jgi:undecaprenyl pyrophosphate phosphatase UppP